ncbi:MAG: OmpA family protein [Cytophagaceae bacterium]
MKNILVVLFFCLSSFYSYSQTLSTTNKKAIKLYEEADMLIKQRKFDEAIANLEQAIKKDPQFVEAYLRLGSSHKLLRNHEPARENFLKAVQLKPDDQALVTAYHIVAEYYFMDGDYDNAINYLNMMLNLKTSDKAGVAAKDLLARAEFGVEAKKNPLPIKPVKLPGVVNRYFFHSFPVLTADKSLLIFTKRDGGSPKDDEDIMISRKTKDGWSAPVSISPFINSKLNEGACTMSADGRILVFSSCYRQDGFGSCDLYISYRSGDQWSKPMNMGPAVNSASWDSEPTLSADGRTVYFTSDRPGGLGAEDIWVSKLNDKDEWEEAVNLGAPINTPGKEVTPFIHANGKTLYFASNYHMGMGNFDIFLSRINDKDIWSEPKNLGYPINSHLNDNTLFITADGSKAYYSIYETSGGTLRSSYLYEFDVPEELREKRKSTYAKGNVYDKETKKPLGASIELIDLESNKTAQKVDSDTQNGEYLVVLTEGKEYGLFVQKDGYLYYSNSFNYTGEKTFDPVSLDIYLQPAKTGSSIVLKNIYFETNSYQLEDKSKTELNKIVKFLKGNSNIKIEFEGHTDDIGSEKANQELSLKRAKSVYDYVQSQGIPANRISYKGYGKTKPVAPNDSEENRQLNRRIEFRIL